MELWKRWFPGDDWVQTEVLWTQDESLSLEQKGTSIVLSHSFILCCVRSEMVRATGYAPSENR